MNREQMEATLALLGWEQVMFIDSGDCVGFRNIGINTDVYMFNDDESKPLHTNYTNDQAVPHQLDDRRFWGCASRALGVSNER
ncbi:hypothetical protein [Burkholderia cenocepacia]|uniref:hypothetical protein n=1 Tax=Burkholderia cenocepacia TaxID=95486 RepID=UPI00264F41AA|nr:hypothetical protein [Burkholderia cenocepacia]MDN7537043.1 hypothetical protein [Burkholderia cenocepacia]